MNLFSVNSIPSFFTPSVGYKSTFIKVCILCQFLQKSGDFSLLPAESPVILQAMLILNIALTKWNDLTVTEYPIRPKGSFSVSSSDAQLPGAWVFTQLDLSVQLFNKGSIFLWGVSLTLWTAKASYRSMSSQIKARREKRIWSGRIGLSLVLYSFRGPPMHFRAK